MIFINNRRLSGNLSLTPPRKRYTYRASRHRHRIRDCAGRAIVHVCGKARCHVGHAAIGSIGRSPTNARTCPSSLAGRARAVSPLSRAKPRLHAILEIDVPFTPNGLAAASSYTIGKAVLLQRSCAVVTKVGLRGLPAR